MAGYSKVVISAGNIEICADVYLVDNRMTPLLGKPAIAGLGLIRFVDTVGTAYGTDWVHTFPELIKGLGSMNSEVKITLSHQIGSYVQSAPRRVAAARKQLLRNELIRMEGLGVIEKIEEATEWCAPCIVVPKKNGKLDVCIDFTNPNKSVRREYHPLPTSEETFSEIGNS